MVRHRVAVAASGTWEDPDDGVRLPAGDVHGWTPGLNQTLCGLPLAKAGLSRFPHVDFADVLPESGGRADAVGHLCHRCRAAAGLSSRGHAWVRTNPRP